MEKDNTTIVLNHFIAALAIPLTRQTLNDELQIHPNYNSLLAISEVLDNWHIPNAAYNLSFEELQAAELEVPFIAFVSNREFITVNRLNERGAIVSNERWNKRRLSTEEFKNLYSGSILIAEKVENSGEADYAAKNRKEKLNDLRLPVVITSAAVLLLGWLLFGSPYMSALNWQIGLLTLFKTAGLVTTVLLLIQSIDSNNPLIQKLCGSDNNKNCNAILSSKAAKLTDELSWSEIGFFYFAGSWLVLLFNSNNPSVISLLALLNLLSLPYTFYSVYHQWKIAKQWCILCCAVQALLWLEFFGFWPSLFMPPQVLKINEWAGVLTGMTIPILGWILLKPYLHLIKLVQPLKSQLRQFKYNREFFNLIHKDAVQYALPEEENTLIIGNPEAEKIITIVSSPYCQPCAKAHKELDWINGRDDVKLQVVFSINDKENDKTAEVATHLMSLQSGGNNISVKHSLDDWYEQKQKNYENWAKQHPVTVKVNAAALKKQHEWCKSTKITETPTIFLNGRKLPQNYQPQDIKYFI